MRPKERGFTVFELLITLGLTGTAAAMAMLGFSEIKASFDKREARYQLEADLKVLRNAAIESGARAFLLIANNGSSYVAGLDYAPYGDVPSNEFTLFSRSLPTGISLHSNKSILVNARGFSIEQTGSLTSSSITLAHREIPFLSAVLYPTGVLA